MTTAELQAALVRFNAKMDEQRLEVVHSPWTVGRLQPRANWWRRLMCRLRGHHWSELLIGMHLGGGCPHRCQRCRMLCIERDLSLPVAVVHRLQDRSHEQEQGARPPEASH